jgi:hypothetical protein
MLRASHSSMFYLKATSSQDKTAAPKESFSGSELRRLSGRIDQAKGVHTAAKSSGPPHIAAAPPPMEVHEPMNTLPPAAHDGGAPSGGGLPRPVPPVQQAAAAAPAAIPTAAAPHSGNSSIPAPVPSTPDEQARLDQLRAMSKNGQKRQVRRIQTGDAYYKCLSQAAPRCA